MSILIIYATIEGQTGKIARYLRDYLTEQGEEVTLFDASDKTAASPLEVPQTVILAASVHERRHPKPFEVFVSGAKDELAQCPTLLVSVSLNAAFPEGRTEAQDYVDEMILRTGFTPDAQMLVAGAVRSERYDYFATQVIRHVILRDKTATLSDGSQEFTDWAALRAGVLDFVKAKTTA